MQSVQRCRVLCLQSVDTTRSEMLERVLRRSGILPAQVDIVADPHSAWERVRGGLSDNIPFAALIIHPEHAESWLVQGGAEDLWAIDPSLHVLICEYRTGSRPAPALPMDDERLIRFRVRGEPELEALLLQLVLTNAVRCRELEAARAEIDRERIRIESLCSRLEVETQESGGEAVEAPVESSIALSHDPLTQLPGRALLQLRLRNELTKARRDPKYQFALLLMNLNRFKVINESFGHQQGDRLLIDVGRRLLEAVRSTDLVCRLSGDEFAVVLAGTPDLADVERIALRLLHSPAARVRVDERGLAVSAAIGARVLTGGEKSTPDDLLRDANLALSRAKAQGGARLEFYCPDRHEEARAQLELEAHLLSSFEREEFSLHYQPIVALPDRSIAGFEALIRWHHPTRGMIPPGRFIPIVEENGLIEPFGEWILRRGCEDLRTMQGLENGRSVFLNLNISHRQLFRATFADCALDIIRRAGVDPGQVAFELTETTMIDDFNVVLNNVQALKQAGIRIFIDDFGVGYSSLNSLYRLPADCLKIDRAFIAAMGRTPKGEGIVRAIIEMGHLLNLQLVAEGIETDAELERVAAMRCDFAQGYLFSRGVEIGTVLRMLKDGRTL